MPRLMRAKEITQEDVTKFCEVTGIDLPQYTAGWLGHEEALVPEVLALVKAISRANRLNERSQGFCAEFYNPMLAGRKLRAGIEDQKIILEHSTNEYEHLGSVIFSETGTKNLQFSEDLVDVSLEARNADFEGIMQLQGGDRLYLLAHGFAAIVQHPGDDALIPKNNKIIMRVNKILRLSNTVNQFFRIKDGVPIDYHLTTFPMDNGIVTTADAFQEATYLGRTCVIGEAIEPEYHRARANVGNVRYPIEISRRREELPLKEEPFNNFAEDNERRRLHYVHNCSR